MSEDNGNIGLLKPTSSSNEDLSEYTDADESISAPTEILAEFLSAVMLKDYETALKYCKLILHYEPNNGTAKEFYPLIIEKLNILNNEKEPNSSGESEAEEEENSLSTNSDSDTSTDTDTSEDEEEEEEEEEIEEAVGGAEVSDKRSKGSSDGDATTGSYSSLEDDEAELEQLTALANKFRIDNVDFGNGNNIYASELFSQDNHAKTEGVGGLQSPGGVINNSGAFISSDSESPTEPVSQQTVAMLRARVVPTN